MERLAEPHPEHVTARRLDDTLHHVLAVAARSGDDDVAEGDVVDEERDAADLEALLAELPCEELLEPTRAILLRKLGVDDEVRLLAPHRFLMDDELVGRRHGPKISHH